VTTAGGNRESQDGGAGSQDVHPNLQDEREKGSRPVGKKALQRKQGAPTPAGTASSEIVEEGVRYKLLTQQQAEDLWAAGAGPSMQRTTLGGTWRLEPTEVQPLYLRETSHKWRIPIE